MKLKDYPDWHDVVAAHWRKTTGYVLALNGLCLKVRDDELAAIKKNRVLVGLSATDLEKWTPPESWLLAVILCPEDSVEAIVAWAKRSDVDADRIHFYANKGVDVYSALRAWSDARLPDPAVDDDITTWKSFHRKFGTDLSVRILQDWGGR